jgi:hypothetical protein
MHALIELAGGKQPRVCAVVLLCENLADASMRAQWSY